MNSFEISAGIVAWPTSRPGIAALRVVAELLHCERNETAETPLESQAQTTPDASVSENGTDNEASSSDHESDETV